jgi:class 3 adenylate cyclase
MGVERRLAAVLAADVVGYSRQMGRDEEGTLQRVKALFDEVIRTKVAEHRGRVVKTTGDGLLAEFGSVFNAFQCALEVQQASAERNIEIPPAERLELRIGINIGDIIFDDDDVFGDGVNIAARLEGLAKPGGICVSYRAWEDLRKLQIRFVDMGEQRLKNIDQPVRVYSFSLPPPKAEPPPEPAPQPPGVLRRHWRKAAVAGVLLVAAAALGVGALKTPKPDPLTFVAGEADRAPCAWLRVSDHSSVDGLEVFKLSGASLESPDQISRVLTQAAHKKGIDVDQVMTTDVAPLDQSQCVWLDRLKAYRYTGVPRFSLATAARGRGHTRLVLNFKANALGPFGAVYGIEPSGAVERIAGAADLARLKPPALVRHEDGSYTLNVDIDHRGWNGIVFMESRAAVPDGFVERAAQAAEDPAKFNALAHAGGWRFELAWFQVGASGADGQASP